MRGLIHAHTYHSFDSLLPPRAYLYLAARAGLDFVCITDHNTLLGARALARLNRNPRLQIVIGAEYATERGDVLGLFLHEDITERHFAGVVAAIHAQGGLALLPHPFRGQNRLDEDVWALVDAIEVFNARSSRAANQFALQHAQARGKPQYAGADIHTVWELLMNGTLVTLAGEGSLRKQLLSAPRQLSMRTTSRQIRRYSQVIKRLRRYAGFPGHY